MIRQYLRQVASFGVLFVFLATGAQIAAADDSSGRTLVGSWVVGVTAPNTPVPFFVDVTTVNKDRTMLNTNAALGTGHGAWTRTGDSTFAIKFMTPVPLVNPFNAPPGSMLVVTGSVAVDTGGQTASGTYTATLIAPPNTPLFGFGGTIDFSRIVADNADD